MKSIVLLFWSLCTVAAVAQENWQTTVDSWMKDPALQHASVGFKIQEIKTGKVWAAHESGQAVIPASVQKLVTTSVALDYLGESRTFQTRLQFSSSAISDGHLDGDVVLLGGGDPSLGSQYHKPLDEAVQSWIKVLKDKGVTHVDGSIIARNSLFEPYTVPRTWIWEDMGNYYGAGASGVIVHDNMYKIHFRSPAEIGALTEVVKTEPEIPGLQLQNRVVSAKGNRDNAYVFGAPGQYNPTIEGSIPANRSDFPIKAAMPNPGLFLAQYFQTKAEEAGIQIEGEPQMENTEGEKKAEDVFKLKGLSVGQLIYHTNRKSVNLFAESLLQQLGLKRAGFGSTKLGIQALEHYYDSVGISRAGVHWEDGSGLSHFNTTTADFLVDVLQFNSRQSWFGVFKHSLPVAGRSGTLKSMFRGTPAMDRIWAKSGSMTRVRCYAGYLQTADGKEYAFALLVNNYECTSSQMKQKIEKLLVEIVGD
ncbi:D-alanyl-D-alanine carboxypeptidase/D-alanyl-D-alanine-endopeptidase [bacterium SCSIO 12741]|nr:D-alanyl-D-alanine carboxypeptidase/D-alanyl-D-alanine-endopeptidase [bacterium SCSIO 12741]